jgi:MOSC domain-containing protein YiiM
VTVGAPTIVAVARDDKHRFSKPPVAQITLLAGIGVEGDAHAGRTVQHRYLKRKDPTARNLTQVHFMAAELFPELADQGFIVGPGQLGENITTHGVDLITLPRGTRLHLGASAVVEITGLRSPCHLINKFQSGLMKACISRDETGQVIRKAGIMGIVLTGGVLEAHDTVRIELPSEPHLPLGVV